jgi:hypothetical protein
LEASIEKAFQMVKPESVFISKEALSEHKRPRRPFLLNSLNAERCFNEITKHSHLADEVRP